MSIIDKRIVSSCFELGDWPLSRVFLKDAVDYPWFILVPRVENIQELYQLSGSIRHQLMDEVSALSTKVQDYFKPDKLNVGTLGNIVSQLHCHVVARFSNDKLWPHGVWQAAQTSSTYSVPQRDALLKDWREIILNF